MPTAKQLFIFRRFAIVTVLTLSAALLMGAKTFKPVDHSLSLDEPFTNLNSVIAVGQPAPNFELTDHRGKTHNLASYKGNQLVLLLFHHGSWCPYCVSHFDDIQNLLPTLDQKGIQLLAISPESSVKSAKLAKRFKEPYIFLADPQLATAEQYGVRIDKKSANPSVFLIDKAGDVIWYHVDQDIKRRPSGIQLKKVIDMLGDA